VDDREAWIQRHAQELRRVLANPQARAEVLALLGGDDQETRRQQRLEELATELADVEVTWKLGDQHGP
jgi:hypothetical protein